MLAVPKNLNRYPVIKNDLLQAWDAGDELMLAHLSASASGQRGADAGESSETLASNLTPGLGPTQKTLILNDSFGALTIPLHSCNPVTYTDSFVSAAGIKMNGGKTTLLHDLKELGKYGPFDRVLIKMPKNNSFLQDLLCAIRPHLHAKTELIGSVMTKHQSKGAFELLEEYIGPTTTSLAQKKARLIFTKVVAPIKASPFPIQVKMETFDHPFIQESNLFSREKLDIGTRFFLEQIPTLEDHGRGQTILDLGCANGIVGIRAQQLNPAAKIIFSDESHMAIQSAQNNYAIQIARGISAQSSEQSSRKHRESPPPEFIWTHCFENQPQSTVDLVLCNPPFHQQMTLGDQTAIQMFKDAHQVLKPGGKLLVIGNSHLKYPQILSHLFKNNRQLAKNPKFTITESIKKP